MPQFQICLFLLLTQNFVTSHENRTSKSISKVLITYPEIPQKALDVLQAPGSVEIIMCKNLPPKRSEILEKVKGVHGLIWAGFDPLNAEVLNAAGPQLRSVSVLSTGFDFVDVAEMQRRNILLGHTTGVVNNGIADHAIGLMIAAMHRFHEGRGKIEKSEWQRYRYQWLLGQDISESTVGFFGFGGIGKTIAKRLTAFDVKRMLYTTHRRIDVATEQLLNALKVTFDTLLRQSDVIFITTPLTPETIGVFNSTAFGKMKKNAVVVNIARGCIINQDDLYNALKTKQIFAAGIDVMYPEPLPATDKLLTLQNLVITPHIASQTLRIRTDMAILAANNVLKGLAGEPMPAPVY